MVAYFVEDSSIYIIYMQYLYLQMHQLVDKCLEIHQYCTSTNNDERGPPGPEGPIGPPGECNNSYMLIIYLLV